MNKRSKRLRRKSKIRRNIMSSNLPRLTVFRSNKHIYAQLIDDIKGVTVASSSDLEMKKGDPSERAKEVGKDIGSKAKKSGFEKIVFDRNGYKYHGRVKALADAAREAGLKF